MERHIYNVILIDDEIAATQSLKRSLDSFEQIQVIGSYNDPEQGVKAIEDLRPDIVFMDIEMPVLDGFMAAKATEHIDYHLVYVTAYSEHALSAFETKVVDYLLKPVRQSRLERCIAKIAGLTPPSSADNTATKAAFFVYDGKIKHRLIASDISYIESIGRYQQVNLSGSGQNKLQLKTIVTEQTMAYFESTLDPSQLMRVHRSYLINPSLIVKLHKEARNTMVTLINTEQSIPVARAKVSALNEYFRLKHES